jgi:hypothetical protein
MTPHKGPKQLDIAAQILAGMLAANAPATQGTVDVAYYVAALLIAAYDKDTRPSIDSL